MKQKALLNHRGVVRMLKKLRKILKVKKRKPAARI